MSEQPPPPPSSSSDESMNSDAEFESSVPYHVVVLDASDVDDLDRSERDVEQQLCQTQSRANLIRIEKPWKLGNTLRNVPACCGGSEG